MQEFLQHGYAGARVDRIVATAGVSKATVYRRFPDKEALFTALIQQLASQKGLFQMQKRQSFEQEPVVFLRYFANEMLDNMEKDPQVRTFLRMIVGESGRFPELARAFVQTIEKPILDFLVYYFANHSKIDLPDPEVATRMFVGTLTHFVLLRNILHGEDIVPMERDRLLDGLLNVLIPPVKVAND